MNILIIARGYPDKNDPQWGGFERDQAEALSSIGHNVVVASVDKRFRLYRRRLGISRRIDGKVVVYNSYYLPYPMCFLDTGRTEYILNLCFGRCVRYMISLRGNVLNQR